MAVVKANAYGHGAVPVARAALQGGATWLGVSSVPEGIELRKAGITEPILNLGYTPPAALSAAVASKLSLTVYDRDGLDLVKMAATEIGVHVKVDSGMHRLGAAPEEAVQLAMDVHADPNLQLEGFWTHFADADRDLAFTKEQLRIFLDARAALVRGGVANFLSHAAGSAGLLRLPEARLDLVRAGLIIYGVRPVRGWTDLPTLRPALTWQTIVTHVMTVPTGGSVGYGRRFRAQAPARVATIALGRWNLIRLTPAEGTGSRAFRSSRDTVMKRAEERREKLSRMRLYVITGDRGDELETAKIVEAALDGGATIIQLRKKSMPMVEQYRLAMALRTLTWAHEALLIINDHADLAIAADADGVQDRKSVV